LYTPYIHNNKKRANDTEKQKQKNKHAAKPGFFQQNSEEAEHQGTGAHG
jgi:hypothetical protein